MSSTPVHRRWYVVVCTAIVVAATLVPGSAASGAGKHRDHGKERRAAGAVLRRRRHAAGPDRTARSLTAQPDAGDGQSAEVGRVGVRWRAPDPGAAEHRGGLVQPRDRSLARRDRVHEQHVPHQRPAVRQPHRAPSTPGVLKAESIAQSAERGGKKVVQFEFAGGRGASTQGPTVDFRSFFSGSWCGDELHRADGRPGLHGVVRAPVRPPGRVRRPGSVPASGAEPTPRVGPTCRRATAPPRRCISACSTSGSTSTASTPSSSTAATTAAPGTTGCSSRRRRTAARPSPRSAPGSGPTSRCRSSAGRRRA